MRRLREKLEGDPVWARVLPFVLFAGLTLFQGQFGPASNYWVYFAKTLLGVALVWLIYPIVAELRYQVSVAAVVVGVGVFVMWAGLDDAFRWLGWSHSYPRLSEVSFASISHWLGFSQTPPPPPPPVESWNPHRQFGQDSALAWLFIGVRIAGSALVVPCLEEVFYRSFVYRYIVKSDFLAVPLRHFAWVPFLATSALFGFAHAEWLAGILCGFAYQGLVIWKNRLGDAMTAHAITHFLLGLWVVGRGAWQFW